MFKKLKVKNSHEYKNTWKSIYGEKIRYNRLLVERTLKWATDKLMERETDKNTWLGGTYEEVFNQVTLECKPFPDRDVIESGLKAKNYVYIYEMAPFFEFKKLEEAHADMRKVKLEYNSIQKYANGAHCFSMGESLKVLFEKDKYDGRFDDDDVIPFQSLENYPDAFYVEETGKFDFGYYGRAHSELAAAVDVIVDLGWKEDINKLARMSMHDEDREIGDYFYNVYMHDKEEILDAGLKSYWYSAIIYLKTMPDILEHAEKIALNFNIEAIKKMSFWCYDNYLTANEPWNKDWDYVEMLMKKTKVYE